MHDPVITQRKAAIEWFQPLSSVQGDGHSRVAHRDFSHRLVVDKLGITSGAAVAIAAYGSSHEATLLADVAARAGRPLAAEGALADIVLLAVAEGDDVATILRSWRQRIPPSGAVWVITPKRGQAGYIAQDRLIPAGAEAGLVDNKVCAVSEHMSAMRFVIRRIDRPRHDSGTETGSIAG